MYRLQKFIIGLSIVTLLATPIWAEEAEKPGSSKSTIHIDAGLSRLKPGEHGWTELMEVVLNGDMAKVNALLEKGVDVNAKDHSGSTALMIAASKGNLEIAKALVNRGADINIQDTDNRTALMEALRNGHIAVVQFLLEKGANTDDKALFLAVWMGYKSIVDAMLKRGIDVNIRDTDGMTPLMIAAEAGHTDVVESLINKGADVNARSKNRYIPGETALMNAAEKGHTATVQVLLANGADANARDKEGRSPLMEAVKGRENTVIKALLAHGADVNARDSDGATALKYAAQKGLKDIVKTLLQNGADVKIKDNEGQSALIYAEAGGHQNIVKMLLEGQAPPAKAVSLLYIQQEKNGCHIKIWEPSTQTTKDLYALKNCPDDVYVDEHTATIFIITDTAIQEIVFTPAVTAKTSVKLPFKTGEVRIAGEVRWNHHGQIGYLKNGRLAAVNDRQRPADDSDKLLYEFDKGKWTLVKQRYCNRFEDCSFDDISGRQWSDWREESKVWHPMLSLNPLIVDRGKAQDTSGQLLTEGVGGDWRNIKLSVNGHESILYYYLEIGEERFGLYTYSIYLKTYKDNRPILKRWYDTSVEYKYLLTRGPHGVLELTDLETGERVLKDLKFAFWIY
jgi:hypothetical protein